MRKSVLLLFALLVSANGVCAASLGNVGELRAAVSPPQPPELPVYAALGKGHRAAPLRLAWVYVQDLATAGYAVVHNDGSVPSYGALVLVEDPTLGRDAITAGSLLNLLLPYPDETPVFLAIGKARIVAPFAAVLSPVLQEPDGYGIVCPPWGFPALLLTEAPRIEPPLLRTPR